MKNTPTTANDTNEVGKLYFISVLGALMAFTSLSTDIYLPAMPQMHKDLQGDVELTISGFLIGFALAQIIWGPISDRIGRKKPLRIGLILFIIGSIGCAFSETIFQIVTARVLQAFGACVGPMLSRAMIRDRYDRTQAAEMLSTLMVVMAIAPIAGPLLGGQIIKFSTWPVVFWVLAAFGAVMFIAIQRLPETLPPEKQAKTSLLETFKKYGRLFKNSDFMVYTLCVTFFYMGVYAFVTGSPAVYITYFNVKPEYYGWLFAINILGLMGFSIANRIWVRKYSLDNLLKIATSVAMLAGIALALLVKFEIGGIYAVIGTVFFFFSMNGIIAACTNAAALDKAPEMLGAAAALLGAFQYGSGVLSSVLLALFGEDNGSPITMAYIMAFFATASTVVIFARTSLKSSKV